MLVLAIHRLASITGGTSAPPVTAGLSATNAARPGSKPRRTARPRCYCLRGLNPVRFLRTAARPLRTHPNRSPEALTAALRRTGSVAVAAWTCSQGGGNREPEGCDRNCQNHDKSHHFRSFRLTKRSVRREMHTGWNVRTDVPDPRKTLCAGRLPQSDRAPCAVPRGGLGANSASEPVPEKPTVSPRR